jgi:hypothetical protein
MNFVGRINLLIKQIVRSLISDIHTHLPAQVVSYNSLTNTCSVQPCINRIRTDDPKNMSTVSWPPLEDVPVKQFGSGKCLFSVAPQVGSYGILHISERTIETWLAKGGVVDPNSTRKFDLSDSVFDPGIYPLVADGDNGLISPAIHTDRIELRTRVGTTYVAVKDDGTISIAVPSGSINIDTSGNATVIGPKLVLNSEADAVALKSKVDLFISTLDTVIRTAWVVFPTDGGAALKTAYIAAFAAPPSTVASTKLKVDA